MKRKLILEIVGQPPERAINFRMGRQNIGLLKMGHLSSERFVRVIDRAFAMAETIIIKDASRPN